MDALDRLYWHLVEALRRDDAAADDALTVARLYQNLVPYRGVRAELGLLELAQYEHALLRLLSGERDYVVLDPEEAQAELRRELASPNPILGVYRDYADVAVRLNRAPAVPSAPPPPPAAAAAPPAPTPVARAVPVPAPVPTPVSAPPRTSARAIACGGCEQLLPRGRDARFCPFCGTSQPYRCRQCGEPFDSQWRFCIDCGEPREADPAPLTRA